MTGHGCIPLHGLRPPSPGGNLRHMEPEICTVCLAEHDEEIHAATLSVHCWFHEQVTLGLFDEPVDALEQRPELPVAS